MLLRGVGCWTVNSIKLIVIFVIIEPLRDTVGGTSVATLEQYAFMKELRDHKALYDMCLFLPNASAQWFLGAGLLSAPPTSLTVPSGHTLWSLTLCWDYSTDICP